MPNCHHSFFIYTILLRLVSKKRENQVIKSMKVPQTRGGVNTDNLDFDGSQFVTSDSKDKLGA